MAVRKVGKAKYLKRKRVIIGDLKWGVEGKTAGYCLDRETVESHPEVRALESKKPKIQYLSKDPKYVKEQNEYFEHYSQALEKIYHDGNEKSRVKPLRLQMRSSKEHSDVQFCLFRGCIYKFDKPNYTDEELVAQIDKFEAKQLKKAFQNKMQPAKAKSTTKRKKTKRR